ncbi:hypothetical protein [Pyxidicoccus xibeiensis]|uniref:hypothetical protein n=1 Tax=Pyxidicoccus xibeiensis TaxID=2906759 RepID=UPI0020A723B0|nr:hypothetical protein [Pyxidicoccus xibeiensis]MCP3137002.1 hypothetical protein [Pyxidicoccus xibeiensis]
MFKHLAMAAACAGLIACGGKEPAPEPEQTQQQVTMDGREVVSIADMQASSPDGQVTVDMRNSNLGFRVEPGLNHSKVTVICPSSRVMNLKQWMPELAAEFQTSPAQLEKRGFTMFPFMAPAPGTVTEQSAPVCLDSMGNHCGSEREPDGSWTCLC